MEGGSRSYLGEDARRDEYHMNSDKEDLRKNPIVISRPLQTFSKEGALWQAPSNLTIRMNGHWVISAKKYRNARVVVGNGPYPIARFLLIVYYLDVNGNPRFQSTYNADEEGYQAETDDVVRAGLDKDFARLLGELGPPDSHIIRQDVKWFS